MAQAATGTPKALSAYVEARAAEAAGAFDQASRGYKAALAAEPGNQVLAGQALVHALTSGDRELALMATRVLEKAGEIGPDARLVLFGEALRARQWKAANAQIDRIGQDRVFSFMAPILRAWLAHASGKGDPFALLQTEGTNPLAAVYTPEHRAMLLIARGQRKQGAAELMTATQSTTLHGLRLRMAAASLLARKGDRAEALALLEGESVPLVTARRMIEAGKRIPGEIGTAEAGIAELLVRMSGDLQGQQISNLAMSFARLATFFAPNNSEAWLVTGGLLGAGEQHQAALAALGHVSPDDPFAASAVDARFRMLIAASRQEEALAQAEAAVEAPGADAAAWSRLATLRLQMKQYEAAEQAYAKAIALVAANPPATPGAGPAEWALRLQQGDALTRAGKWPEGKAALEAAYKLAPGQAVVLNYLGYAQLERRENLDEAERLIREASRLEPDNAGITDSLGWALYLRGKHAEAIPLLERAARAEPTDAAINEHLGDAYYGAGRRFEARYAWQAALITAEDAAPARITAKIERGLTPELAAP